MFFYFFLCIYTDLKFFHSSNRHSLSLSCIRARNNDNYTLSNITVTLHLYIDTYEFPVHMFIESSLFLIVKEEIIKKKQFSVSIRLLLTLKSYSLVILASILFWAAFRTFEIVYAYIHSLKAPYFSFFFFSFFFYAFTTRLLRLLCYSCRMYLYIHIRNYFLIKEVEVER